MSIGLAILLLWGCNFIASIKRLARLRRHSERIIDLSVPEVFTKEVESLLKNGYKLTEVNYDSITLLKTKRYWFPWLLMIIMPNGINLAISTSLICNTYGVELKLAFGKVEASTF